MGSSNPLSPPSPPKTNMATYFTTETRKEGKIDSSRLNRLSFKRKKRTRCLSRFERRKTKSKKDKIAAPEGGGGILPYMGYIGMCRCKGYGFQAVYSSIGYINQSIWV